MEKLSRLHQVFCLFDFSVGLEDAEDLIGDLKQALDTVVTHQPQTQG